MTVERQLRVLQIAVLLLTVVVGVMVWRAWPSTPKHVPLAIDPGELDEAREHIRLGLEIAQDRNRLDAIEERLGRIDQHGRDVDKRLTATRVGVRD